MRIKTIAGLAFAGAAAATVVAGGAAYAGTGGGVDAEPRMRIVQQDTGDPAGQQRDCPRDVERQPTGDDL